MKYFFDHFCFYSPQSVPKLYRQYMDGAVCACGASALELYRSSKRLIPTLLDKPRTGQVAGLLVPPALAPCEDMARRGINSKPYHLLVDGKRGYNPRPDIHCTACHRPLPPRSLIKVEKTFWTTGPELTLIELCADVNLNDLELIQIFYELCGTYVLDNSWDGLTNTDIALTSSSKVARLIASIHRVAGIARARKLIKYVHDGSNSPMETALAMLVSLPTRMGGLGLGPIAMNHPVATPVGLRHVDIVFPKHRVGLEYQGKQFHSIEQAGRDARRQNKIVGSGYTILNVWYDDLVIDHLFQQFVTDLFRALEHRQRIRAQGFDTSQKLLRMQLMPAIEKFGGDAF